MSKQQWGKLYICQCVGFHNFSRVRSFGQQLVRSVSLMNNWAANQNGDSWLVELYIYQSTLVLQTMLTTLILIPSRLCYVQCWQGWRHINNDWYKIKREYSTDFGYAVSLGDSDDVGGHQEILVGVMTETGRKYIWVCSSSPLRRILCICLAHFTASYQWISDAACMCVFIQSWRVCACMWELSRALATQ